MALTVCHFQYLTPFYSHFLPLLSISEPGEKAECQNSHCLAVNSRLDNINSSSARQGSLLS